MYATTTKQLMDQSKCFRLIFWGSIFFISVGVLLMIIFPFTTCSRYSYYSCSWYYYNYPNECTSFAVTYCCQSGYGSCGSYYCIEKPLLYRACDWVIITGGSMMGVGFFLAIFVFIMFCNFRGKIKNGAYLGMPQLIQPYPYQAYQGAYNPNYAPSPVIVYSDQPNSQTPNHVNLSENS